MIHGVYVLDTPRFSVLPYRSSHLFCTSAHMYAPFVCHEFH